MIVGRHRRVDWVLFVGLLAGACGGSKKIETGEACTLNSDCRNPLSCSFGKCHETCVTTRDCPLGSSCVMTSTGGVCQLVEEADCRATGVCAPGLLCAVDYRCRSTCQSGAGCSAGQVCVGGVCAEPGDVDTSGNLPIKNPGASAPGQGGGTDAGFIASGLDASILSGDGGGAADCVIGPGGYCWSLWAPASDSNPKPKASWVGTPTPAAAHVTATSGVDSSAGATIVLIKDGVPVDLGKFDQMWIDADVPVGKTFEISLASVSGSDITAGAAGCLWDVMGIGPSRYTIDLASAHYCWPTACGFDRSAARVAGIQTAGWGATSTLDASITGLGFQTTTGGPSATTTSGSPGTGPNGWCTSMLTWGDASAEWMVPPTATSVQIKATNGATGGFGGVLFDLPAGQRDLSRVTTIEFDADIQTGRTGQFRVTLDDLHTASCYYNKPAAAGPRTYSISLANPGSCLTGDGHVFDRTIVHDIRIGTDWNDVGPATFKITRLALKSGDPVVTPDAGVAGPVDARPPTTGADAAYTTLGTVSFSNGSAQGLFSGGWVALGEKDILTSPGCDTGKPISNAVPCTTSHLWSRTDALCMSGTIPALPASPVQDDYDSNWGLQIGVNASEPSNAIGDALADAKAVTFTISGLPTTGLRAIFHRKGDPTSTPYCVENIKSGVPISLSKFNTKCWREDTGVFLTPEDLPKIDIMALQVSSTYSVEITVQNLCLEKVEFAK